MNLRKIALFSIGPLATAVLGIITLPLLSWYFDQVDIGRIAIYQSVIALSGLFLSFGMDQAYVREYHEKVNKPKLFKNCTGFSAVIIILLAIISFTLSIDFSKYLFDIESVYINWILVISIICYVTTHFITINLRMEEEALVYSLSKALFKFIFIMLLCVVIIFSYEMNFVTLISTYGFSYLISSFLVLYYNRKFVLSSVKQSFEKKEIKSLLKLGLPLTFSGIAYWGLTSLDKFFLKEISDFKELAIYSVAISFASAGTILQTVFSTIWAPTVYKWVANGQGEDEINKVADIILGLVLILFSLVGMFSWVVEFILPDKYSGVASIMVICISCPLFYTLSEVTKVGIGVSRRSIYSLLSSSIACAINIAGNLLLIPNYGALGAAMSTALSFWIFLVLRTEFSLFLWDKLSLNKSKIYIWTLSVLFVAIASSFFNDSYYKYLSIFIWTVYFVIVAILWKVQFKLVIFRARKT
ncbi:lipopolysaccharide biosynthesis protein [Photobacterium leiognathi]|uniref:lipopolysaccharide biosynthesis protein n=1 Tax=Photobacterium leiognathi TaxID=553611 RepID=UPI002981DF9F|nr:oligosaccharide flippase family protein [Photobacterium leiognathi]